MAASFANPAAFVPTPAGPLGGEFLIRASRLGGMGGDTVDQPDGKWCGYWAEQAGAIETVARGGRAIEENGDLAKISLDLRGFLGDLAGPVILPRATVAPTTSAAPTGLLNMSAVAMQPIQIGGGKLREDPVVQTAVNVLNEDETQEERDTVLLSRSKHSMSRRPQRLIT